MILGILSFLVVLGSLAALIQTDATTFIQALVNHNRPLPPVTIEALNRDRSFDRRQYLNKIIFNIHLI
ncbi:hypothetical protein E0Z11_05370 [Pasteurella multocida subsp. multocida]|nr:hypothetical protein E0Z11_05370 [Pasteurella multocida subsp. multocida]